MSADTSSTSPRGTRGRTGACMDLLAILWMDEIHFTPPKKPWNNDSPCDIPTNNGFPWCPSGAGHRPSPVRTTIANVGGFLGGSSLRNQLPSKWLGSVRCSGGGFPSLREGKSNSPKLETLIRVTTVFLGACNLNLDWKGAQGGGNSETHPSAIPHGRCQDIPGRFDHLNGDSLGISNGANGSLWWSNLGQKRGTLKIWAHGKLHVRICRGFALSF